MTDDDFHQLLVAQAKVRLANMSEGDLIELLIAQHGEQMKSDLLDLYEAEQRERDWNVRKPRKREQWQQALADHLNEKTGRNGRRLNRAQKIERLPESEEHSIEIQVGEHEFGIYRDEKFIYARNLTIEGSAEKKITFSAFVRWMKPAMKNSRSD